MSSRSVPVWSRILPQSDHRWAMGLRPGDLTSFVLPWDPSGVVLAERQHWLRESPDDYAALTPACESALRETIQLVRNVGITIPELAASRDLLLALGQAWESDFVWMVQGDSNDWILGGGVVCFPSSWSMPAKLGMPMSEVHAPVPRLNTQLGRQIDTFLTRMDPGVAWLRENAGLSRDAERNHHTSRPRRPLDETVSAAEIFIRVEHQLLFKLPISRAILFGIRVEVFPLPDLLKNQDAAEGLLRLLTTIEADAADYKGLTSARAAISALIRNRS